MRRPCTVVVHERAGADAGRHEPLARQPVVCHRDGGTTDTQMLCQFPSGREDLATPEPTIDDGTPQLPVDLPAQIVATHQADVEIHQIKYIRRIGLVKLAGIGS
jgi:hypothetical protein